MYPAIVNRGIILYADADMMYIPFILPLYHDSRKGQICAGGSSSRAVVEGDLNELSELRQHFIVYARARALRRSNGLTLLQTLYPSAVQFRSSTLPTF